MADLNVTYAGYVETLLRPQIKVCKGVATPFGCIGPEEWEDAPEAEELTKWRDEFNRQSPLTVDNVKVAYQAGQDKNTWLEERINAVNVRVKFIEERCEPFRPILIANGALSTEEKFGVALTTMTPIIGKIFGPLLGSAISSGNAEGLDYAKQLIAKYQADLEKLALIRAQLIQELAVAPSTTDPTSESPVAWPLWYYFIGAGVLILFLLYLKKRRNR